MAIKEIKRDADLVPCPKCGAHRWESWEVWPDPKTTIKMARCFECNHEARRETLLYREVEKRPRAKRYDSGTVIDKHDQITHHICPGTAPCYHCKFGLPYPDATPTLLGILSAPTLRLLLEKNLEAFRKSRDAVRAIRAELIRAEAE